MKLIEKNKANIYVISGPSAVGNDTIIENLQKLDNNFHFVVTATTRKPRKNEKEGKNHFFYSEKTFKKLIQNNDLIEWAKVYKNYYGSAFEAVDSHHRNGDDVLIELDVQGAQSLRAIHYKAVFIFIMPPSLEALESRLKNRGTESASIIQERLKISEKEIQLSPLYDYILTNVDAEQTTGHLLAIITAEHLRKERYKPSSPDLDNLINDEAHT